MRKDRATGDGLRATGRSGDFLLWPSPVARRPSPLRFTLIACVALACSACTGSLFESDIPTPNRYVIAAAPRALNTTESAALQVDLSIGRPDVAPGLDTNRIAVKRGRELDYFRAAQWGGSVLEIVQAHLVASFQDQLLFRSVTPEQARVSSDYIFDVEIRDFQAEYRDGRAAPDVRVTIIGRIIRIDDRELVETIHATAERQATENHMNVVAAAFEAATQQVALELARKTAAAVVKDRSER